jgi:hypothetical protein
MATVVHLDRIGNEFLCDYEEVLVGRVAPAKFTKKRQIMELSMTPLRADPNIFYYVSRWVPSTRISFIEFRAKSKLLFSRCVVSIAFLSGIECRL